MSTLNGYTISDLDSHSKILTTIKPIPKTDRVFAYLRCSTEYQVKTNGSIDVQLDLINRYLQTQGLSLPHYIYVDESISGNRKDRLALEQLTSNIVKNDVLILSEISRLSRNLAHFFDVLETLQRRKVRLHVVDMGPIDKRRAFEFNLRAILAREESDQISDRVSNAMRLHAERGGVVSRPHFGKKIQDGRFVPDPHQMEVVEYIRSRLSQPKPPTLVSLIQDLRINYPANDYGKKNWYDNDIRRIRHNYSF